MFTPARKRSKDAREIDYANGWCAIKILELPGPAANIVQASLNISHSDKRPTFYSSARLVYVRSDQEKQELKAPGRKGRVYDEEKETQRSSA